MARRGPESKGLCVGWRGIVLEESWKKLLNPVYGKMASEKIQNEDEVMNKRGKNNK